MILRKNLQTMVPKNAVEEINDRAMKIYWNFFLSENNISSLLLFLFWWQRV